MTTFKDVTAIITGFKKARIVCVGDLMLDLFVYGEVSRISPEAPIPVLKVSKEFQTLGGAGNVVNNLLALGAQPHLISVVGDDQKGNEAKTLLAEKGLPTNGIHVCKNTQTIQKRRFATKAQQLLRVDYEQVAYFDDAVYDHLRAHAESALKKADALILSDYGKGVLHPEKLLQPLIQLAKTQNIPIVVDPKGTDYTIYRGATLITPNRKELYEATGMAIKTDHEIVEAAQTLIQQCGVENVLATRSEDGMTLVKNTHEAHHYRTKVQEVFDVSGAGDTVVATVTAAIATGSTLQEAAYLSNIAGSLVVAKSNTATISDEELIHACTEKALDEGDKVLTVGMALEKIKIWHRKGLKVGFTNGCFDLLHEGHIRILRQSREACDRLIVAINSDASVKRLKGSERPINDERTRATIISCLKFVDAVIIFEEDTPLDVINCLLPDVLVKGADYTIDQVVGADIVTQNGGKVVLVDLVKGRSSSALIEKIKK